MLAPAGCVLNDVYREAATLGIPIHGVRVTAIGGLADDTWTSTGIRYVVEVDSPADRSVIDSLLALVDDVAEIPRALRASSTVERAEPGARIS